MTQTTQLTLSIKQGEVIDIPFNIATNGEIKDLTGATILFQVKRVPMLSSPAIVTKEITETSDLETVGQITYPESGKFQVHLNLEDTSFAPNDYYLVIWLKQNEQEDIISSVGQKWAVYRICTQ